MTAKLPPMPAAEVHRATWDDGVGWTQYHDKHDPLPAKWDDEPPDEVCGFYSIHQLEADRLAVWKAAIEAAAEAMNKRADDVRKANTYRGRIGSASLFVIDQLEFGASAIRAMGDLKG